MKKLLLFIGLLWSVVASAQFTPGQVLTAAQLNAQFLLYPPLTGATFTGPVAFSSLTSSSPIPISSGGTGASTASGATSQLQYLEGLPGTASRSVTNRLQDTVSILDFPGCDKTGTTDSTSCIQAAFNSGAVGIYVPGGSYKYTSLTIPATVGFTLFGDGPDSQLLQQGTGIKFATQASIVFPILGTIRDLAFNGTNGSGNTIDTTYVQNLDLKRLVFQNVPTGFSSINLNGNPTSSTYAHDVRLSDIRIYSSLAGFAGIHLGSFHSDSTIDSFIMNGQFVVSYCIYAEPNAQTTVVSNSHPYNAAINVVNLQGNNNNFGWVGDTFDNATNDIFYAKNASNGRFTNVFFEEIPSGFSGIVFDNAFNNKLVGISCSSKGISTSCAREVNGASGNSITYGTIDSIANYTTAFNLSGVRSSAESVGLANTVVLQDGTSGNSPNISAQGTDTNVTLALSSQGTFGIGFYSNHFGDLQVQIPNTTSANRSLTLTGSNGGNPTIGTSAGNVGFAAAIAPSSTLGIIGTTAADNANAGSVGEFISASVGSGVPVPLTTAIAANVTSISLTPGDWDVSGDIGFLAQPTTVSSGFSGSISTSSATMQDAVSGGQFSYPYTVTGANTVSPTGTVRITLTSTTTVFLVARASFTTSTLTSYGIIRARRVR